MSRDGQCGSQLVFRPNLLVNACDGRSVLDEQSPNKSNYKTVYKTTIQDYPLQDSMVIIC